MILFIFAASTSPAIFELLNYIFVLIWNITRVHYSTPAGLEDVSKYPELFAELLAHGWSEKDIQKLAGLNLIRVFKSVEQVSLDFEIISIHHQRYTIYILYFTDVLKNNIFTEKISILFQS